MIKRILTTVITVVYLLPIFSAELNIYTSRHYDSDNVLYAEFTKRTGIKVNVISGNGSALLERLKSEGSNSPADLFFTVDAGNLWKIQKEGYFQSITSNKVTSIVPKNLIGPNNEWVAIAKRARVAFYNPKKVNLEEVTNLSYLDLGRDEWKGRVVIRSSNNIYNQSLVASLIANYGIERTESWARNFVSNFSRKPQGNDRAQIMAVAKGQADIAIANSYYYGLMLSGLKGDEQKEAAENVTMLFPSQKEEGVHINISGLGILKSAKNLDNANKFIEFLLTDEFQEHMVFNSFEYPISKSVSPHPLIEGAGLNFKEDQISVTNYGKFNSEAVKLMDRVGWK